MCCGLTSLSSTPGQGGHLSRLGHFIEHVYHGQEPALGMLATFPLSQAGRMSQRPGIQVVQQRQLMCNQQNKKQ